MEKEEENTLLHALATPFVLFLAPKRINKLVLMLLLLLLLLREYDKDDDDGNNAAALRAAIVAEEGLILILLKNKSRLSPSPPLVLRLEPQDL